MLFRLTTSGSFVSFLLWWVPPKIYGELSNKYPCWAWIFWPCLWLLPSEHSMRTTTLLFIVGFNNIGQNFRGLSFPQIHRNPSCAFRLPIHVELARAHLSTIQFHLSIIHPLSLMSLFFLQTAQCHKDVIVF